MLQRSPLNYPNNVHQAAMYNDIGALKALVPKKLDAENYAGIIDAEVSFYHLMTQEDHQGRLPIDCAATRGHITSFDFLLDHYLKLKINLTHTLLLTVRAYKDYVMGKNIDNQMSSYYNFSSLFPNGKFNNTTNAEFHFRRIIEKLMRHYPNSIHTVDKYNHSSLFYVVELFVHGLAIKSQRIQKIAKNIMQTLLRKGATFNDSVIKPYASEKQVWMELAEMEKNQKTLSPPSALKKK